MPEREKTHSVTEKPEVKSRRLLNSSPLVDIFSFCSPVKLFFTLLQMSTVIHEEPPVASAIKRRSSDYIETLPGGSLGQQ